MTCVIGYIGENGRAWMGGDRRSMMGDAVIVSNARPKIRRHGNILIGTAGTHYVNNLLDGMEIPEAPKAGGLERWLWSSLYPAIRKDAKERGLMDIANGIESLEAQFLFAGHGELYYCYSATSITVPESRFWAIGCATSIALSAMSILSEQHQPRLDGRQSITAALGTAARFDPHVAPPFDIISDQD